MLRLLFFLLSFSPFFIYSQSSDSSKISIPVSDSSNSSAAKTTERKNYVVVNEIKISGNKVTKQHIILREIPFSLRDTLNRNDIPKLVITIKQNLLNTSLFNFVTVDTLIDNSSQINFSITVAERWYTWPVPIFEVQERNFNEWWKTKNINRANYGFYLNRENFRGRKEELSFYAQFGYTEKYGISYSVPYLTHQQTSGAGFSFSYSRNREIAYKTLDNHLVYFKNSDEYIREELNGKLNYTYREGIHNKHYLEGRFVQATINDTLKNYSKDYFLNNETQMKYFALTYSYRSDYRDSRQYPLRGYFWEFEMQHLGFGILKDEKLDVSNLFFTLRGYEKLSNRFYLSSGLKIKFSPSENQPYYVQKGLGWRDYVRGYEYYVIDAQSYATTKVGLKYEILKPRVQAINIPALNKFSTFHYAFYANIFGDMGYAKDDLYSKTNPLANQLLYGYGAGIDYVTYYDVVIRFEYSFNKMFEHGFFLHLNSGI